MQQLYLESVPVASNKGTIPNDYIPLKYNQSPPGSGININRQTPGSGFEKGRIPLTQGSGAGGPAISWNRTKVIDEEKPIKPAEILNTTVLKKIDDLLKDSKDEGNDYAVLQLAKLREYVICLPE
jgi:hypothetical protein